MPNLISRLNCFAKKKNSKKRVDTDKETEENDDHLLLTTAASNSTAQTHKIGNSDTSRGSKHSTLSRNLNHQESYPYDDDDNSIPTMDSDYNNVQSGNFSLSDAGGTIGTQNQSLTNFSQSGASAFGSIHGPSAFGAESSFKVHEYYNPSSSSQLGSGQRQSPQKQPQQELLEIYAPGGKLGLVIDTPTTPFKPIVVAIKDTCPIRNEIDVGDYLVAVDDVDVREMSATEVSRLISRKSVQERRKLTIVRTARGRDGIY